VQSAALPPLRFAFTRAAVQGISNTESRPENLTLSFAPFVWSNLFNNHMKSLSECQEDSKRNISQSASSLHDPGFGGQGCFPNGTVEIDLQRDGRKARWSRSAGLRTRIMRAFLG
jgi:hypothetical protein